MELEVIDTERAVRVTQLGRKEEVAAGKLVNYRHFNDFCPLSDSSDALRKTNTSQNRELIIPCAFNYFRLTKTNQRT